MKQSRQEIIKKFIRAYNSFDISGMVNLLHPEIKFKNITNGKIDVQTRGKDEFERLARQSSDLFKEREQKISSLKETGDKINIEIQYHAILAVDLPNGLKAGDSLDLNGKSEYIFKDGLIYSIVDES